MPARRFIGYFFALAACSTLAFASFSPDSAVSQDASASAPYFSAPYFSGPYPVALPPAYLLSLPYARAHRHKAVRVHLPPAPAQVAQAG